jgi:hypothetical protein
MIWMIAIPTLFITDGLLCFENLITSGATGRQTSVEPKFGMTARASNHELQSRLVEFLRAEISFVLSKRTVAEI